ncbi:MAG: SpoIID/LytB domain-containing protein, partial [Ruminiclostridium sp.]
MKNYVMMTVIFAVMLIVFPFVFTVAGSAFSGGFDRPEKIRLLLTDTGEVTEISMEDYVTGCLFAQIPVDYEEEALKAQAVCAYTYALRIIKNNKDNPGAA